MMSIDKIRELLGDQADALLNHTSTAILPSGNFVTESFTESNRSVQVMNSLQRLYGTGRLANTGYLSILPIDQGIEHSAGASFAPNPMFFDPENIVKMAIDAECNAVASTYGVLATVARKYAHKIPFVVKINHNEYLSHPNTFLQSPYGSVDEAWNMGACAVGATIYFGHPQSREMIEQVAAAFERAHELGMATILWCYTRNDAFKVDGVDYHTSADLSSQAIHLGVTIQADIIKQKLPTNNGGYNATGHGKTHPKVYSELTTDNPIDLTRYQVLNSYNGRIGVINSGGASTGDDANDLSEAVLTAVVNKRAGGQGLILGRKAFQKEYKDGLSLLRAVQDVYLNDDITIA
jgi:class I fructose-bisphosphate aldolase